MTFVVVFPFYLAYILKLAFFKRNINNLTRKVIIIYHKKKIMIQIN